MGFKAAAEDRYRGRISDFIGSASVEIGRNGDVEWFATIRERRRNTLRGGPCAGRDVTKVEDFNFVSCGVESVHDGFGIRIGLCDRH